MQSEKPPTFSVIIPTYNRAPLVAAAVESVLNQTFQDFELIVVDDGSQDETRHVLKPYLGRIRYTWQPNGGVARARNRGLADARGRFVGFLDSDDCWDPHLLEAVLGTFEQHPEAGAVVVAERMMTAEGRPTNKTAGKRSPGLYFTPASMIGTDTGVGSGRPPVVRLSVLHELGGFDESLRCAVDSDMWIRCSFRVPMVYLPDPLVLRRIHPGNLSADIALDARDWLRILDKLRVEQADFIAQHERLYRDALAKHHLRLGRELLVRSRNERTSLREARQALERAIRLRPAQVRAYLYLAWSFLAPSSYARWRRFELRLRR